MQGCLWVCTDHSHERCVDVVYLVSGIDCLLSVRRCLLTEGGAVPFAQAGDNACQVKRGQLLQIITPKRGKGDTITLAHPGGPYVQIHRKIRWNEIHPDNSVN